MKEDVSSRRSFLKRSVLASAATVASGLPSSSLEAQSPPKRRPNVLMICADQMRADFVCACGENPSVKTKNLDAMARRGVLFRNAVSNQPLCSPSRASFLTSRYATETGVWRLALELDHSLPTIADVFNQNGYMTKFVGKWHVSQVRGKGAVGTGWVGPGPSRGGFQSWEGANVLELVSHPYEGSYWDDAGNDLHFHDEYRVDFVADRAIKFIAEDHDRPWFMFVSQLEPHHQNDINEFVPPKEYEGKYNSPYVPKDLRERHGNWQEKMPGYYGCVQRIDDSIGRIQDALARKGELENTVILFFSDHGNAFDTRIGGYKRSPHESSIRVPLLVQGPGFDHAMEISQLVSLLDLTPTLLDAAGITAPSSMKGRSLLPLVNDPKARAAWDSTVFIQLSEAMCARALRTAEWTYCVYDPTSDGKDKSFSTSYTEWALYSLTGDPYQQENLIGRPQYRAVAAGLREELKRRILGAGEAGAEILPARTFN
jgi:arylsulfatase A-like enzyme